MSATKRSSLKRELNVLNFVSPASPKRTRRESLELSRMGIRLFPCSSTSECSTSESDSDYEAISLEANETDGDDELQFDDNLDCNSLLYIPKLWHFMCKNFSCARCRRRLKKADFDHFLVGIAGGIEWRCFHCDANDQCQPLLVPSLETTEEELKNESDYNKNRRRMSEYSSAADCDLNWRFNIMLQRIGGGFSTGTSILSMLSIRPTMYSSFSNLEEAVNLKEIEIGQEVMHSNMLQELKLSLKVDVSKYDENDNGPTFRHMLSVQCDTGWSNRGSGKNYNSDSGHSVMIGNKTKKVISLHCMSKRCEKCARNIPHDPSICSMNYDGSSKGMEAHAAAQHVQFIWENYNAFIYECVMDDDSSSRAVMRHNQERRLELGLISSLAKTKSGNNSKDNGKLPKCHPPILELCDHNHRTRGYAKKPFFLARSNKEVSLVTSHDAERLKQNHGYWLRQNLYKDFDEFFRTSDCVIEHLFNCHTNCGDWCAYLRANEKDRQFVETKYRDKILDESIYRELRKNHDTFMTEKALRMLHHSYDTNLCESFMHNVSCFCPKTKHLCNTINYKARCFLTVGIDSLGYDNYYEKLFGSLGLDIGEILKLSLSRRDIAKTNKRLYRKRPEIRARDSQKRIQKVLKGKEQTRKSNIQGNRYGSGIGGPGGELEHLFEPYLSKKSKKKSTGNGKNQNPKATNKICPYCGRKGHVTKRSKKCLHYKGGTTPAPEANKKKKKKSSTTKKKKQTNDEPKDPKDTL